MADQPLGDFLRTRRGQLDPRDAGVALVGPRRRVSGLRREEVAQLAGVSVSYYTRLEQGYSVNASKAVIDALATVFRLDEAERAHLHALAVVRPRALRTPPIECVDGLTRELMRALAGVPAYVMGRRGDVLSWNAIAHALLAGHLDRDSVNRPDDRPNLVRMMFLDPPTRELYVDWQHKADATVGYLRMIAGRYPEDALLRALVEDVSARSAEFSQMWSGHTVAPCAVDRYELRHPLVGLVTVNKQVFSVSRAPEQTVVVLTTDADSSSADALQLLSKLVLEAEDAAATGQTTR